MEIDKSLRDVLGVVLKGAMEATFNETWKGSKGSLLDTYKDLCDEISVKEESFFVELYSIGTLATVLEVKHQVERTELIKIFKDKTGLEL